jgi:hypothetical protein
MARSIKIFKSLEEQEEYHLDLMRQSSVLERFRRLYAMQQMSALLHPPKVYTRKIIIRKWTY